MSGPAGEGLNNVEAREAVGLLSALIEASAGFKHGAIDDGDLEAIELFALLAVVRRRRSRLGAAIHFIRCMLLLPTGSDVSTQPHEFSSNVYLYGEVLRRWWDDAAFVDENGRPRILPVEGPGSSFASLVNSIDSNVDPTSVLTYLVSIKAVARFGEQCEALQRKAIHYGVQSPSLQINFESIVGHLRACESHVREGLTPQYSYTADGRIPVDRVEDFRKESRPVGDGAVITWDESMSRMREEAQSETEDVEVRAGAFVSLGGRMPSLLPDSEPDRAPGT